MILSGEYRDGYPYRLRIIGHLHEAEDEAQAYSQLHTALRGARKAFQQKGIVPDFDSLSNMATKARGVSGLGGIGNYYEER